MFKQRPRSLLAGEPGPLDTPTVVFRTWECLPITSRPSRPPLPNWAKPQPSTPPEVWADGEVTRQEASSHLGPRAPAMSRGRRVQLADEQERRGGNEVFRLAHKATLQARSAGRMAPGGFLTQSSCRLSAAVSLRVGQSARPSICTFRMECGSPSACSRPSSSERKLLRKERVLVGVRNRGWEHPRELSDNACLRAVPPRVGEEDGSIPVVGHEDGRPVSPAELLEERMHLVRVSASRAPNGCPQRRGRLS